MLTVKEKPSTWDNTDGLLKEHKAPLAPQNIITVLTIQLSWLYISIWYLKVTMAFLQSSFWPNKNHYFCIKWSIKFCNLQLWFSPCIVAIIHAYNCIMNNRISILKDYIVWSCWLLERAFLYANKFFIHLCWLVIFIHFLPTY